MSRTFTREDTRKLAAVLAETALAEVMPRYRNLPEGSVRNKSSPRDLVTDADEAAERQMGRHARADDIEQSRHDDGQPCLGRAQA